MSLSFKAKSLMHVLPRIVKEPRQIKYLRDWRRSYWSNSFDDQQPWITFAARDWLESHLREDMSVFEYGSGGSTLYFLSRVRQLVSVEHDALWYQRVVDRVKSLGFDSHVYLLKPPGDMGKDGTAPDSSYLSDRYEGQDLSFVDYVTTIDGYPDRSFDIVMIDGRCRNMCAQHAINKVKVGGFVMLDNSERPDYGPLQQLLKKYPTHEFGGLCPYGRELWKTTVWEITN